MAHGDAVVDGDGVELLGHATGGFNFAGDELAEILQVDVAGDELGEGIDDRDDRLAEIAVLHAGRAPEAAGTGHVAAVGGGSRTIGGHGCHLDGLFAAMPAPSAPRPGGHFGTGLSQAFSPVTSIRR